MLASEDAEFIIGDLREGYARMREEGGGWRARIWFWRQTVQSILAQRLLRLFRAPRPRGRLQALDTTARELRFAFRSVIRRPLFALTAVLTIALGVGPTLAVLSLVEGTLLRRPPFHDPDRLVFVWGRHDRSPGERVRLPLSDVSDLRSRTRLFDGFAGTNNLREAALENGGRAEAIHFGRATPNFFELLGVEAALGRVFGEADTPPDASDGGSPAVIVLSDALWRRSFGADPSLLGRTVRVDGVPFVVVGVLAPDFRLRLPPDIGLPDGADAWVPVPPRALDRSLARDLLSRDQDSDDTGVVLARLAPRATLDAARSEVAGVASELRDELPVYRAAGVHMEIEPVSTDGVRHVRPILLALLAASVFVLVLATVNIAYLLVVRASGRSRETAVRVALGASRPRMLVHGLAEAALLASVGAVVGILLAPEITRALLAFAPAEMRVAAPLGIDAGVTVAVLVATVSVTLLVAALVVVRGRTDAPAAELHAGSRASHGRQSLVRHRLVSAEIALAGALLLGAALTMRSAVRLSRVDPGFRAEGALYLRLSLRDPARYLGPAARGALTVALEEKLASLPGVESVGVGTVLPLSGRTWTNAYGLPGEPTEQWLSNEADYRMITPGFLGALGVPLLAGRYFTRADDNESRRLVIVDEALAQKLAGAGADARSVVGRRLALPIEGRPFEAEIVGVVGTVRHQSLSEPGRETLYVPYRHEATRSISVVVRTAGDPEALAPALREAVSALDPQLPIQELRTLTAYLDEAAAPVRFALFLLGVYAAAAIALSGVGVYGVVGYAVSHRRRELGVRMALGAEQRTLVRAAIAEGMRRTLIGLLVAAALSVPFALLLRQTLYGVQAFDPVAWGVSAAVLTLVALGACYAPARAIARLDPMKALSQE
jgi:predicted permease